MAADEQADRLYAAIMQVDALQPDARFDQVEQLVAGDAPHDRAAYARELAGFLSVADYPCRHPAYAYYFAQRYGSSVSYGACSDSVPFFLFDRKQGGRLVHIRPDHVSSIHVMFSSGGDSLASRFGHVSLRLIVCPDGPVTAERCERNLFEHVVLGYMARVDGLQINPLKGMVGGYAARLQGMSFMEAYRANTLLDDRNLYSVPLKMDHAQVEQIVRELSEVHWRYRGDYRFFTNNCATLLQDALAQMVAGYASDDELARGYLRPDTFFAALRHSPLVDARWLDKPAEAEARGYYFPSNRPYYRQARELIAAASQDSPAATLDQYASTPAKLRLQNILSDVRLKEAFAKDAHVLDAQILLEEYTLMQLQSMLTQRTIELLSRHDVVAGLSDLAADLGPAPEREFFTQCYLEPLAALHRQLPRADGIPDDAFLDAHYRQAVDCNDIGERLKVSGLVAARMQQIEPGFIALRDIGRQIDLTLANISMLKGLM
ncbi:lipoprotein N-acyltransferase Lnb domain-containing protein [Solimonas marina]|uniref:DUF4105 domain-containing protein n=1 Tax=Solimonas marina TaxID=2714601 RepID=A0A969WFV4_9GAMM|nr:DUF4105 domain-containing protein [Solimonas marina]NKF24541.1 DUF4105 domain-containing protein [Solimonas marina]